MPTKRDEIKKRERERQEREKRSKKTPVINLIGDVLKTPYKIRGGKPKLLLGGLLTKGIKYAAKSYMKRSGRNISKLTKLQPKLSKNKRAGAKSDMATAIQMQGTKSFLNPKGMTMKDINKLQTYKNKLPKNY